MAESGLGVDTCTEPSANPTTKTASPEGQLMCVTDTEGGESGEARRQTHGRGRTVGHAPRSQYCSGVYRIPSAGRGQKGLKASLIRRLSYCDEVYSYVSLVEIAENQA